VPRATPRVLVAVAVVLLSLVTVAPAHAYGPKWPHDTILNGQYTLIPLKDQAMITREQHGYRFRAGQQHSHLVVTTVNGGLRFHDSGTKQWRSLDPSCRAVPVAKGVAATCAVPFTTTVDNPMLIEIWPRLGDDFIDTRALPAQFQTAALVDAGNDVVRLGAGDDFVNGAFGHDRVWGGPGDDWLRTGPGADRVQGGPGDDRVVGAEGPDIVLGGPGNDSVEGGAGDDHLYTGVGVDRALCGSGHDRVVLTPGDRAHACELVLSGLS
jgi:serralysin